MAQLKDLIVNGASQLIGDVYTSQIQISKLNALTDASATTYGAGSAGQVLMSNGTNTYWGTPAAGVTESTVSGWGFTKNAGTVTSVRVQATAPVVSSSNAAQTGSLNTTISLAKTTANYVLAGPSSGTTTAAPTYRKLVAADIPSLTLSKISDATDLAAIEALTGTTGLLKKTAANTWALDTTTYVSAANAVTDVSFNSSDSNLYKTINGTTTAIIKLPILPGSGTDSAYGGGASSTSQNQSFVFGPGATVGSARCIALGQIASATGSNSIAIGYGSTTEKAQAVAIGGQAHAKGMASFALGLAASASAPYAVAIGPYTEANGEKQIALGAYNIPDNSSTYCLIVGNGDDQDNPSNALTIDWNGNTEIAGSLIVGTSSYGNTLPTTGVQGQIFFKKLS